MQPSSHDLHPRTGARFVFDRDEGADPRYSVTIYLPGTERWSGRLAWVDGQPQLEVDEAEAPTEDGALIWAQAEALKLARVLRHDPKQRIVRWRGR